VSDAPLAPPDALDPLPLPGRFRAAVFDMDGLLLDTEPAWVEAEREVLSRRGYAFTDADVAATHGRSVEDSIVTYAALVGEPDPAVLGAELMAAMRRHYERGAVIRPGARELVSALRGRMRMAIASNTGTDLVRLALDRAGLLDAFEVIVTSPDVGQSKPHPAVYLEACSGLGVSPGDAVAFEDSIAGVGSAKAAGLWCIAVPDRPGVDLARAGADLVVASLADVPVEPSAARDGVRSVVAPPMDPR
jgi:HAD superfamily hydrolase (TIGR01509 family)